MAIEIHALFSKNEYIRTVFYVMISGDYSFQSLLDGKFARNAAIPEAWV